MSAYNFGGSGPTLTKLYQVTWHEAGVIKWTLILQGVPPTKFWRAQMSKIRLDFSQLSTLIADISGMDRQVDFFSGDYNSALRGCWPLKFLHTLQLPKMYFKSYLGRRAASC